MGELRSILAIPCDCRRCLWDGVTGDCEADDEGCLVCPICYDRVVIHYSEHELNPVPQTGRK